MPQLVVTATAMDTDQATADTVTGTAVEDTDLVEEV